MTSESALYVMRRDRLCKHLQNDNIISVYFRMKAERQQKQPFIAKHCKMQGKVMDLAAKRRLGQGWSGLVGVRPGGMRGGRILRFAEADTASASAFRLCAFNTA